MSEIDDLLLEKARSEARTAAKQEEEAEEARLKAVAEREAAESARDKTRAENAEWIATAQERRRTADLTAQTTQFSNWTSLQGIVESAVPDFANVKRGELIKPDDKVLFSTLLKTKALRDAAGKVRDKVRGKRDDPSVVITADPLLLQRDALRIGLQLELTHLSTVLNEFPLPIEPKSSEEEEAPEDEDGKRRLETLPLDPASAVLAGVTAVGKLVPQVLSLFVAHRKLTMQDLSVEAQEAVAAVAGSLAEGEPEGQIVIDAFRFLTNASDDPTAASKSSGSDGDARDHPGILASRDGLQAAVVRLQIAIAQQSGRPQAEQQTAWLAAATMLTTRATEVLTEADTIPPGATMSPITAAAAVERLRLGDFAGVVLVTVSGATAVELTSDRLAAFKDRIHSVGTVALSYVFIDRQTSVVISAGTVSGHSEVVGTVGKTIDVE